MTGFLIFALAAFLIPAYLRASARLWTAGAAMFLAWLALAGDLSAATDAVLAALFIVAALALNPGGLRRRPISAAEQAQLQRSARRRDEVIRIDNFPQDFGRAEQALLAAQRAAA